MESSLVTGDWKHPIRMFDFVCLCCKLLQSNHNDIHLFTDSLHQHPLSSLHLASLQPTGDLNSNRSLWNLIMRISQCLIFQTFIIMKLLYLFTFTMLTNKQRRFLCTRPWSSLAFGRLQKTFNRCTGQRQCARGSVPSTPFSRLVSYCRCSKGAYHAAALSSLNWITSKSLVVLVVTLVGSK